MVSVQWRSLADRDLDAVIDLAGRCLAVDGGLPGIASRGFLERRYTGAATTAVGALDGGQLVACGAVRSGDSTRLIVGQVDPEHRGRGLGGDLVDRLLALAARLPGVVRLETESVTPAADELFRSRDMVMTFAEDVMSRALAATFSPTPLPTGVTVEEWNQRNREGFFQAYQQSFADRPGFPEWTGQRWVGWTVDDEFLPGCSLLARDAEGTPTGFVTCADGFLIQIGTVPAWRGRGLGRALAVAALERMRGAGQGEVYLDVNANNPTSRALFEGLGFTVVARRARYDKPQLHPSR